jgi:hypothetical protein
MELECKLGLSTGSYLCNTLNSDVLSSRKWKLCTVFGGGDMSDYLSCVYFGFALSLL